MAKKKKQWSDSWKDNWKGHYQNPNDPYQARIFNEEHKNKYDQAREHYFKTQWKNRKGMKFSPIFLEQMQNIKDRERDVEIENEVDAGRGQDVLNKLLSKGLKTLVLFAIIIAVIVYLRMR